MGSMSKQRSYIKFKEELDFVLEQLETEQTDVDQAIVLYEKGTALVNELKKYLKTAKNRVKVHKKH